MALFEITRRGSRKPKSVQLPPLATLLEGIGMMEDVNNPASGLNPARAALSDGTLPTMFLNRASAAAVPLPTLAELSGGLPPVEQPYTSGYEGSLEDADEVVAEGTGYISTYSEDLIDANTALKSKCSFNDGKFCVARSGQMIEFQLIELPSPEVAGNIRGRFERVAGPFA